MLFPAQAPSGSSQPNAGSLNPRAALFSWFWLPVGGSKNNIKKKKKFHNFDDLTSVYRCGFLTVSKYQVAQLKHILIAKRPQNYLSRYIPSPSLV